MVTAGPPRRRRDDEGIALLVVIAALVLVLALGSALVLTTNVETSISATSRDGVLALSAADSMASRVLAELRTSDWNSALGGAISTFTDGPPSGARQLPNGRAIDLQAETFDLLCGRPSSCSDSDITSVAEERPWGTRNPRWRLFAYGPLAALLPGDPSPPAWYLVSWIADDPPDNDADPFQDGSADDDPGHGVLMVTARAYGPRDSRRTVELAIQRVGTELRILTWRERHQ